MRAFVVALAMLLPLAGCLGQDPAPERASAAPVEASPEAACAARGLAPMSCEVFCNLNPQPCGLRAEDVVGEAARRVAPTQAPLTGAEGDALASALGLEPELL